MTVAAAVEAALTPLRTRLQHWMDTVGARTIRRLQWGYLLTSLATLWWLLGYTERRHAGDWVGAAFLSTVYLAVIGLLSAVLVPKTVWLTFAVRFSRVMKLAVVVNYLTALLLMQNFIATWAARANLLAGLFVATWVGAWLLCRLLWPMHLETVSILLGGGTRDFDSADPQGRSARSG